MSIPTEWLMNLNLKRQLPAYTPNNSTSTSTSVMLINLPHLPTNSALFVISHS